MLKALVRKALPATTRGRKRPREELEAPAASPATALVIEPVVRAPTRPRCSSAPSTAHPPARRQLLFGPTAPGIGKENIAPAALVSSLAQPEKTEVPPVASRTTLRTAPRPAKRARAKAFSFSQLQIPSQDKKVVRQRVAECLARAQTTNPPPSELLFQPVSVFSEVAQFRGLDDAGLCLDFLFMGKGDRRLGSAEGLRRRIEAREPLVGDIFSSSDIMAKAQCGDSPEEEENEPGALMHHWSQAQSDPSNYEEDEFALVEPFTGRSDPSEAAERES